MEGFKKCFVCQKESDTGLKMLVCSRLVCEDCLTAMNTTNETIARCLDRDGNLQTSTNNTKGVLNCLCQDTRNVIDVSRPIFEGELNNRFLDVPFELRDHKRFAESRFYSGKCFASDSNLPRLAHSENAVPLASAKIKFNEINGQTTPRSLCEKHDFEVMKFYCQTCKIRICRDCAILDHREHDFVYCKENFNSEESLHERLKKLLEHVEEKQVVLNEKLENIDFALERKSKEIEEAKMKIKAKALRVRELISDQEELLLSCLDGHMDNVTKNVKAQKSALESALDDVNHGLEIAQEIFKRNSSRPPSRKPQNGFTNLNQETPEQVKSNVGQINGVVIETCNHGNHPKKEDVSEFESEADFCDDISDDVDDDDGILLRTDEDADKTSEWTSDFNSLRRATMVDENLKISLPKNPTFDVSLVFGDEGSDQGKFHEPVGVTVSCDGTIFVADYNNDRIQVFDKKGEFLRSMTHSTTKTGRQVGFLCPTGLATDKSGNIIVAERGRHRITVINPEGHIQHKFGKLGKAHGQFRDPHGVSVDKRGRIIVADTTNNRIQVFDKNGEIIFAFGHKGEHVLDYPNYAIFHKGVFIVSDTDNDSVKIFDKEGQFLRTFGNGETFGAPSGLAVYKDDYILVCDFNNDCVKLFTLEGELVTKIGHEGTAPGEFSGPEAVVVTSDDKIIVTDKNNSRVQVFELNLES